MEDSETGLDRERGVKGSNDQENELEEMKVDVGIELKGEVRRTCSGTASNNCRVSDEIGEGNWKIRDRKLGTS